jgi:hypothetical protein
VFVIIGLALLLTQVTGAYSFLLAAQCRASCADDQPDGCCSPSCVDCSCCFHAQPVPTVASATLSAPAPDWTPVADLCGTLPIPEPNDILHVPISTLA